jgi:hypothetical protein
MTATAPEVPEQLLARAAVALTFDPGTLVGDGVDVDDVVRLLTELCEPVVTPSGRETWTLRDDTRRHALATLPVEVLREARSEVDPVELTAVQRAVDRSLDEGWFVPDIDHLSIEDARALSVVARWWQGRNPALPAIEAIQVALDRLNLFSDVREMAGDHFVGREDMLRRLRDHFKGDGPAVFALHGVGGVGKSALLARHIVWALDDPHALVARIDFDDATLNAYYSLDVLARIVRLVTQQTEGRTRAQLERLAYVAEDAAATSAFRDESSSRGLLGGDVQGTAHTVDDMVRAAGEVARSVLVVFDTVEQVQRRGGSAVEAFRELVEVLSKGASLRVVVAGRAEVPELYVQSHALTGLSHDDAVALLLDLCARPLSDKTAELVVDGFGTSPLTVRLVARLLSDENEDEELNDLLPLDLHAEQINAVLYRRILQHIRDEEVRMLAHPGLILRRVTPDLIRKVLAKPCSLRVRDDQHARDLFQRLSLEAMLVERHRHEADVLVHRGDIRSVMLPQLLADKPEVAAKIQRAAIRYYAQRSDLASRTEELYHRLMLGQTSRTIEKHWDPKAADAVYRARSELPTKSRIILTERLPETFLTEEDRHLLSESSWVREVEPQVKRLVERGSWGLALMQLRERRGPRGESLLPSLEIDALEGAGDFDAATELAREQRRLAALANDGPTLTTYTLDLVRLAERMGDPAQAEATLTEALAAVREPSTDRLRLVIALLGLWRRNGRDPQELNSRRQEAVALYDALGVTRVRAVPGLLRDLAAEVGAEHPDIQDAALRSIGIDASVDGEVPDALRRLDDQVRLTTGRVDAVADLTQLVANEGADVEWREISTKPRGETGRLLLNVMRAFPPSNDDLRRAVTVDYQIEADAALFGHDHQVAHKA